MSEWDFISDDTATYNARTARSSATGSRTSATRQTTTPGSVYEIKQATSMTPGTDDYMCSDSSLWENDWQLTENLWERSNFDNVSLFDSDPDGGGEGTVGVTVGYAAAPSTGRSRPTAR
jgi:hypothetical protein